MKEHFLSKTLNRKITLVTIPLIMAEICTLLCVVVDSAVAQHYIDDRSVAAIALLSVFMLSFQILHDLIGSCTSTLITRRKIEHGNEVASKDLGSIIVVTAVIFSVFMVLIFLIQKPYLFFMTDDRELIHLATTYYLPILLTSPLFEIFLVIERGYRTEGNLAFFSARPIITNLSNMALDLFFVVVLGKGIRWLGYATVISTFLGYVWSLSYGFRKTCKIRPDFKGIFTKDNLINSLYEQTKMGIPYLSGDLIDLVNIALIQKTVLMLGGSMAMVSYGVVLNIGKLFNKITLPAISNANIFTSAMYVSDDRKGFMTTIIHIVSTIFIIGIIFTIILVGFPKVIAAIYNISGLMQYESMRVCTRILAVSLLLDRLLCLILTVLISVKQEKLGTELSIIQRLVMLILVLAAGALRNINILWISITASSLIVVLISVIYMIRKKLYMLLPEDDLVRYSIMLNNENIGMMTGDIMDRLSGRIISPSLRNRIMLIVEECSSIIVQDNGIKNVLADIRIKFYDEFVKVFFYYDGKFFSAENAIKDGITTEGEDIRTAILGKIVDSINYTRLSALNCLEYTLSMCQKNTD